MNVKNTIEVQSDEKPPSCETEPPSRDNQSLSATPIDSCQHGDIHNNECANVVQWRLHWAGRGYTWAAALPALRSARVS